ncbi:MAG: cytochrome c3 family protein [Armatimonadota bacterium]
MKKLLGSLQVLSMVALASGPSVAGLAHVGSRLICSDCHTMHYSMQHNYRGRATDLVTDTSGPFQGLLKASPNDLCLACHDGTGVAPDVLTNPSDDFPRQAGALNRIGTAGGYETWMGHTLDSKDIAPGGTWSDSERGLSCVDCHAQHGIVSQFRNLWSSDVAGDKFQGKTLTYAFGDSNDITKDVWLHDGFDIPHRYGVVGTEFNEPDAARSRYGEWCSSCHANFHGSANVGGGAASSPWKRHPTADINIGANTENSSSLTAFQSHTNRVKVMSSTGNWSAGTDVTPSCFSCHKAHGNKNPFGLIYMSGTGTVTEEGDTGGMAMQDLCRQCHAQ